MSIYVSCSEDLMLNTLVPKDWILLIDKGADVNEPLQVRPFLREKEAYVD